VLIELLAVLAAASPAPRAPSSPANRRGPEYAVADPTAFQSFIGAWSPEAAPLCAILASRADWDAVLHPAAVMGPHKPFAPPDGFWRTHGVLLVAQTAPASPPAHWFSRVRVAPRAGGVTVTYVLSRGPEGSSTVKAWLPIVAPKPLPQSIRFEAEGGATCAAALGAGAAIGTSGRLAP
jgi:hypothetical protein